jgi:hypothetical protein
MKLCLLFVAPLAFAVCLPAWAQQPPRGFASCAGNPPAAISVSNTSANVQLSTCGPNVYLINDGTTEAFWALGSASSTVATTSSNPILANSYQLIIVPGYATANGWYLAAITSSSTTTLRIMQGFAQ